MGASSLSYTVNNSFEFAAMDLMIITSLNYSYINIRYSLIYTFIFTVGQYYSLSNVSATYFLPDRINYVSSSVIPASVVDSALMKGYFITYNFPDKATNSVTTVTINAKVSNYYRYKIDSSSNPLPVAEFDNFAAIANVYGYADEIP